MAEDENVQTDVASKDGDRPDAVLNLEDADATLQVAEEDASETRLVPMQIGEATVYVRTTGSARVPDDAGGIYPAAGLPTPKDTFEQASKILHECIHVIGEGLSTVADAARPREVTVEFSLSFEGTGKAALIPLFVTTESKASAGLKVTAVWQTSGSKEALNPPAAATSNHAKVDELSD
jgi:hypothetical protein